jgi:hypothetical protein
MENTINILPDKWLTATEAATALRVSVRTVQKMGQDGRLKRKPAGNSKNPSASLYDPKDVQRHMPTEPRSAEPKRSHHKKQEQDVARRPAPPALETALAGIVSQLLAGRETQTASDQARIAFERERWIAEQAERAAQQQRAEERSRPWITLDEAVIAFGMARADLLALCRAGSLTARKAGGWRILRRSLEAFTEGIGSGPQALRKAGDLTKAARA